MIRRARASDAEAIAKVQVDSWRATYRGIVADAFLDGMSCHEHAARWRDNLGRAEPRATIYVAEDPGRGVVGFIAGGRARQQDPDYDGELYAIYLLETAQRRGLGRALTAALVDDLVAQGYGSMLVWVLAANPSCGFYERLSGQHVRDREIEIGGQRFAARGYGWPDLLALQARLKQEVGR